MLIISRASASGITYWQRSAAHSTWLGQGAADLGLQGPVEASALRDLLLGRRPGGPPLTARPGARHRHGWDLVFAAPKSVSLLALSGAGDAGAVRSAFRDAVGDALAEVEARAAWLRYRGQQVPAAGVVAASFEHTRSDAGQPHLHAHVVLANLGKLPTADQREWGCLVGTELWRWREGLGPLFNLNLRHHLAAGGLHFDWAIGETGLGEVASVPQAAKSLASSRSREARAGALRFGASSHPAARTATMTTRSGNTAAGLSMAPGQALAREGLSTAEAERILASARAQAEARSGRAGPTPSRSAVEAALAERASDFGRADVYAALAVAVPEGLSRQEAAKLAASWCRSSAPVRYDSHGVPYRWTTSLAVALDDRVESQARALAHTDFPRFAKATRPIAEGELGELGLTGPATEAGSRLACSGQGISVVPRAPWLAQAACVDAARAALQAAGVEVGLLAPTEASAARWRALTGLSGGTGDLLSGSWGRPGRRALVVDAADHLSPAALARLTAGAVEARTKLVLVVGGTQAALPQPSARSMAPLVGELGAYDLGPAPLAGSKPHLPPVSVPGIAVQGAASGRDVLASAVSAWASDLALASGPGVMVAPGPAEARALNDAARELWLCAQTWSMAGATARPEVRLGERNYAIGDRVISLRRAGTVAGATLGTVVGIARDREPRVTVTWTGRAGHGELTSTLGPKDAASLGHAYATTLPYLRAFHPEGGPPQAIASCAPPGIWVLGSPGRGGARPVTGAWVALKGLGRPVYGLAGEVARRRAGARELATNWPDGAMLDRAGPRPLSPLARIRWAEEVTRCALERMARAPARHGLAAEVPAFNSLHVPRATRRAREGPRIER